MADLLLFVDRSPVATVDPLQLRDGDIMDAHTDYEISLAHAGAIADGLTSYGLIPVLKQAMDTLKVGWKCLSDELDLTGWWSLAKAYGVDQTNHRRFPWGREEWRFFVPLELDQPITHSTKLELLTGEFVRDDKQWDKRRMVQCRRFRVDWRSRFDAAKLARILDPADRLDAAALTGKVASNQVIERSTVGVNLD